MTKIIHITGASGAGTTTLGQAAGEKWGHTHMDSDDFYWVKTDPMFTTVREVPERQRMMWDALGKAGACVISGSLTGWGDIFIPRFALVVFIYTPTEVRFERLKKREYQVFGERIRPGGDMYEEHMEFISWAGGYDASTGDGRSMALHRRWLSNLPCPVLEVDGEKSVEELLDQMSTALKL